MQIIAGARDPAVPPANAEFLHDRLPRSKLDILDAGHFTWEDADTMMVLHGDLGNPYTLWTAAQGVFQQGQGASS